MYNKRHDIHFGWDYSKKEFIERDPDFVKRKMSGISLKTAIRCQGWFVRDVYLEYRKKRPIKYDRIRDYAKVQKPMQNDWEKLDVWNDIKETCDRLGIFWDGFVDLPELPDNDF